MDLKKVIRSIPDFPKKGIMFRDVTPLFTNPPAFREAVDQLDAAFPDRSITAVAAVESRGFIFGGALAYKRGIKFVPVRKAGKLPHATLRTEYALEYGSGVLEVHADALSAGDKVVLIDDLIATGGTAEASVRLLRELGAEVVGAGFLIELAFLPWREKLAGIPTTCLISYADENP
ncbi:MAG TPA: adenine phosphoribosyltransferase [Candidatus Eisenbacteria bacterium]